MPWKQSDNRDPWSNKGPPDLDELFMRFLGMFKRGGGGRAGGGDGDKQQRFGVTFGLVITVALVVWLLSGIYIVNEGERGVILRFGAYLETTRPGPHWRFPYPIETVETVDVDSIRSAQNKTHMLTRDENIVEVEIAVQYRVRSASDFLFNVRFPDAAAGVPLAESTLFQVMESALREVVGKSEMDYILGEGRAEVAARTKDLMQETLDGYMSGVEIISVNFQQTQPPAAVQDAFADAIKAREDEVRYINEAEAYANGVIPTARGEAARMVEEATAYRERVVENSEGEAERFLQLYSEYRKAPDVTRERLYIQALEAVLSRTTKMMMDVDSGNSLLYLPLDRLIEQSAGAAPRNSATPAAPAQPGGADRRARGRSAR